VHSTRSTRRRLAAACLWALCAATVAAQQAKEPAVKRAALLKLAEPWPDAEVLHARRDEAQARPLFAAADAFPLTLAADFKVINKDRAVEGKKDYPGTLTVGGADGKPATLHVKLRTRGHFRLRAGSCSFVPLRVEFDRDEARGTIFDGQKTLKLVTHCRNDSEYEQYTLREYLVYRTHNLLTPRSFRARLTTATYQSNDGSKTTKAGMFLEDDDDVARRMEGRVMDVPRIMFKDVDRATLAHTMIFEYMVGNTDFSMYALHNVRYVKTPANIVYTVPYDWDLSGLVDTIYALPDRQLGIRTVRERLYRGPCMPAAEIEPVLDQFRARKAEILSLYETFPGLTSEYRRSAKDFLGSFFRGLDRPGDVKRTFVEGGCTKNSMM
jgi:hypothetical protein